MALLIGATRGRLARLSVSFLFGHRREKDGGWEERFAVAGDLPFDRSKPGATARQERRSDKKKEITGSSHGALLGKSVAMRVLRPEGLTRQTPAQIRRHPLGDSPIINEGPFRWNTDFVESAFDSLEIPAPPARVRGRGLGSLCLATTK